ncbi:RhoGAP domain-containing protein [Pholiota molesta]|nr:RhoGAP domain-containing protein [Pholiota molesta]
MKPKDLSATLILHTMMGKDHLFPFQRNIYTCFANKLSRLTRLRGPIRSMGSPNDLLPENNAINAPREVMRLVNWMMEYDGNTVCLPISMTCSLPRNEDNVQTIRECLDTGDAFPFEEKHRILRSHLEMTNRDEAFEVVGAHSVWISVTAFLHYICQRSKKENQAERVATVLAPVFLRDDPTSFAPPISPMGKRRFLLYFIT